MWSSLKRLLVYKTVPREYCAYTNVLIFIISLGIESSQSAMGGSKLDSLHYDYASWLTTRRAGFPLEYQTLRAPIWLRNWITRIWFLDPGSVNDSPVILEFEWCHRKTAVVEGVHRRPNFCISIWHGANPGWRYLSSLLLTPCWILAPSANLAWLSLHTNILHWVPSNALELCMST